VDISLERVLSLIEKKPDGRYVHGAKKEFCETIGAPANIINEWERGVSRSYRNYFYAISAKYDVSAEWLKGETDDMGGTGKLREAKEKPASQSAGGWEDEALRLLRSLSQEELERELAYLRERTNGKDM